jgi:hypothetical protein
LLGGITHADINRQLGVPWRQSFTICCTYAGPVAQGGLGVQSVPETVNGKMNYRLIAAPHFDPTNFGLSAAGKLVHAPGTGGIGSRMPMPEQTGPPAAQAGAGDHGNAQAAPRTVLHRSRREAVLAVVGTKRMLTQTQLKLEVNAMKRPSDKDMDIKMVVKCDPRLQTCCHCVIFAGI